MAPKVTNTNLLSTYTQVAQDKLGPLVVSAKNAALSTATTAKDVSFTVFSFFTKILDKYPPVKACVYSLAGLCAVPLAVFTGYAGLVAAVLFTIAGTIIAITQGSFLAFGAFVLFWFLVGALILASIVTFWFTSGYFALQVHSFL